MKTPIFSALAIVAMAAALSLPATTAAHAELNTVCFEVEGKKDENGDLPVECEDISLAEATCEAIEYENEVCESILEDELHKPQDDGTYQVPAKPTRYRQLRIKKQTRNKVRSFKRTRTQVRRLTKWRRAR